jgi:hypothetical protein
MICIIQFRLGGTRRDAASMSLVVADWGPEGLARQPLAEDKSPYIRHVID